MISLLLLFSLFIAFPFFDLSFLLFAVVIAACAFVLFLGYKKGMNKAEISLYLTALFMICILGALYLTGAKAISDYSISAVFAHYEATMDTLRQEFVAQLLESLKQQGDLPAELGEITDAIEVLFIAVTNLFLALLAIIGFLYAGIQIKVFTHIAVRVEKEPRPRRSWYFGLSNIFAYFYAALFILSTFFGKMDSIFSIALMNLYYIFLAVFAYVGFNYALATASRMKNKHLSQFFLAVFVLMANVFAAQLLSLVGIFITTMQNKFLRMNGSSTNNSDQ